VVVNYDGRTVMRRRRCEEQKEETSVMQSQSYEASVLFPAPFAYGGGNLQNDLTMLAEAHGMALNEIETEDSRFRLFDFGPIQILLAAQRDPMEPAHFLDARRPQKARISDTDAMSRLTAHRFVLTVLVAENPDNADPDTVEHAALRHRLCWQITESLRSEGEASLVFWCDNDTLYGAEEFEHADVFNGVEQDVDEDGAVLEENTLDVKKMTEAKALAYMDAQIVQGAHKPEGAADETEPPREGLVGVFTRPITKLLGRDLPPLESAFKS